MRACCIAVIFLLSFFLTGAFADNAISSRPELSGVSTIKTEIKSGFSNAGWKYDRYTEIPVFEKKSKMMVADIKGPAVIRHIHFTRHHPGELFSRGAVLEIWFDDAKEPAVMCPLADFFGDGCNGKTSYFSTPLIEAAPWSYNCYFEMPFKERARVILRNDTEQYAADYSYVEWEPLSKWDEKSGYFHATYHRRAFQLSKKSNIEFFKTTGKGHIIGRQLSVISNEPAFNDFGFIMEGNNEINIDGQERAIDYLGTEDSFTFSWGFQEEFTGLRAGMPYVKSKINENDGKMELSIYRFHDHMPIRFAKEISWRINWEFEFFRNTEFHDKLARLVAANGCWVDYATVFYWYQDSPGGYKHQPLREVGLRTKEFLGESQRKTNAFWNQELKSIKTDPKLENTFESKNDVSRLYIIDSPDTHPIWIDYPREVGGNPGNPNPGKRGIVGIHPLDSSSPCYVVRKVAIPKEQRYNLHIVVSGDPYESPANSDFRLQIGLWSQNNMKWLSPQIVKAGQEPNEENWKALQYSLSDYSGQTIGIIVQVSAGGPDALWFNEEAFFDTISVTVE